MAKYKYKTKKCGDYDDLEKCLNEYGQLGYRVFQISNLFGGYFIIFEKEVNDDDQ